MSIFWSVFAISYVVVVVHGGCQAGPGQELLSYDEEYKQPLKPPIRQVVREVSTKKVHCVEAVITEDHLGTGSSTNSKTRAFAKKLGYTGDLAGYLVPRILGGTGTRTYNIVPQSEESSTGREWRVKVGRAIRNKLRDDDVNVTSFIVEPQYDSKIHPTRPHKLKYSFTFSDGTGKNGFVDNPEP